MSDFMEGMQIICKYSPNREVMDEDFDAGITQIWCGKYTGDKMSVADKARMAELGWFEDGDWGMWSCYT